MFRSLCIILLISCFLAGSACQPGPSEEDRARQEKLEKQNNELMNKISAREEAERREREKRKALEDNPDRFIETGTYKATNKGIINDYAKVTDIKFTNNSDYNVTRIKGEITYLNTSGDIIATSPFSASGQLLSGETSWLKVKANEVSGKSKKAKITVTSVRILN